MKTQFRTKADSDRFDSELDVLKLLNPMTFKVEVHSGL